MQSKKATPREAVYAALRFEQGPICPYYIWVADSVVPDLAPYYGEESFIGAYGTTRTFAGSYSVMTEVTALPVEERGDWFRDEFGAVLQRGAIMSVTRPALEAPNLAGYSFPDLTTDAHFRHLDAWCETHAERFKIVQLGMLFFERTWFMRGMEEILMDFHCNPAFVHDLLDRLEEVCNSVIDRLLKDYSDRIDAIGLSEDYGSQRSLLMSPAHWREFIKPRLARIISRIRKGGKKAYLHSCGHVLPLIQDFVEIGVDMLQPLQPEAMDVFEVKRRFGKDICLVGGISTQYTLLHGEPGDVREEVRKCLDEMAAGGGYIMAPAKPILPGVPIANARALIDSFLDQQSVVGGLSRTDTRD